MKTFALAAGSFALALGATPALAGNAELPTETVSTAGLDLGTAEGQRMLDERIDRAARRVCRVDTIKIGTRIQSPANRECVVKARASARKQMTMIIEKQQRGG